MTEDLFSLLRACDGYEERLDVLRVFTREKQRALQERDLAGSLTLRELFSELTALAEAVLKGSLQTAWGGIFGNDGAPALPAGDFAVVAMGKLGGRELTYRSDLDLITIYENPSDQAIYTRLATRIISALSILTRQGIAYAVDTALRPSGNRGTLVSSLSSFLEYHRTLGRTWERQSLIKARPLFGRPDQRTDFTDRLRPEIESIAYQTYDPKTIAGEIDHLRGRMEREIAKERLEGTKRRFNLKTGRGGLVDIEFCAQYLQLVHGAGHPNVRNPNTISALKALATEGILDRPLAAALEEAYLFLRGIETRLRLFLDQPADNLIEGAEWLHDFEARYYGGESLLPRLIETRERVRSAYERVLT
jgi:glutamate-ammonia-ligase adenylyltransferase